MPRKTPPAQGVSVKIKAGDWVGNVAAKHGHLNWEESVWAAEQNQPLREKRHDPHLLAPNDQLFIPGLKLREESGATEALHVFRLRSGRTMLRVRLLDSASQPLAAVEYEMRVETNQGGRYNQSNTATNEEGVLEEWLPVDAVKAVLRLKESGDEIELNLGHLDPLNHSDEHAARKAAQQRLHALGLYNGAVDGSESDAYTGALAAFRDLWRRQNGGSGGENESDAETLQKLKDYYGC